MSTAAIYENAGVEVGESAEFDEDGDVVRWGMVVITAGRFKGWVGYLDDEHSERSGYVYFDVPFATAGRILQYRWMRPATAKEIKDWNEQIHNEVRVKRVWKKRIAELNKERGK